VERARKNALDNGASTGRAPKPVPFSTAAKDYVEEMGVDWSPKTTASAELNIRHLAASLGSRTLDTITAAEVSRYKILRKKEGQPAHDQHGDRNAPSHPPQASPLGAHRPDVKFLKTRTDIGRALSDDEVRRLLAAARQSRSRGLCPALLISLHTGLRNKELRTLRWADVEFDRRTLRVGESKTEGGRGRHIPLSRAVFDALQAWRSNFPNARPQHYLFPTERVGLAGEEGYLTGASTSAGVDPTKPIGSWRTAFNAAKKAAGIQCRWHDLRHHFASRVGESGVSEQTLIALAGWMSRRMLETYSHPRMEAKRQAIAAFDIADDGVGTILGTAKLLQ
jgi:integrase